MDEPLNPVGEENVEGVITDEQLYNYLVGDFTVADETVASILSSAEELCKHFDIMLSSIPVHPFERLKKEYLGNDCSYLSLSDVEVPENFCLSSISMSISSIADKYSNLFDLQVQALTSEKIDNLYNAFAVPSGDDFVIDNEKVAKHLQYVQMINNIPVHLIDENPMLVAQKLLTQYVNTY